MSSATACSSIWPTGTSPQPPGRATAGSPAAVCIGSRSECAASTHDAFRAIVLLAMRKLILVRHGQYEPGTGALTALGRRQAAATVRALRGYELDAIHCSTMARAKETALILKQGLRSRLELQASPLLRERLPTPVPGVTTRADL